MLPVVHLLIGFLGGVLVPFLLPDNGGLSVMRPNSLLSSLPARLAVLSGDDDLLAAFDPAAANLPVAETILPQSYIHLDRAPLYRSGEIDIVYIPSKTIPMISPVKHFEPSSSSVDLEMLPAPGRGSAVVAASSPSLWLWTPAIVALFAVSSCFFFLEFADTKVQALQPKIQDLINEKGRIQYRLERLHANFVDHKKNDHAKLQRAYDAAVRSLNESRDRYASLSRTHKELKQAHEETVQAHQELQKQSLTMIETRGRDANELGTVRTNYDALKAAHDQLQSDYAELNGQKEAAEASAKEWMEESAMQTNIITAYSSAFSKAGIARPKNPASSDEPDSAASGSADNAASQ